jgi:intracellular multiplication protein IcmL
MSTAAPLTKTKAPQGKPRVSAAAGDILDEKNELERFGRLRKLVSVQTYVIGALVLALVVILPFAQPVYLYYAMNPDQQAMRMVGLSMPNMTNRAVLSWATTSITEIMTMGFGDMDRHLPRQKGRFTDKGWEAYGKAFNNLKIGETFKQSQLVLTTVPSNTPVILSQFVNPEDVYEWVVQMPVIMTYATNNNRTQKQPAIVTLAIVRVPSDVSSSGIAIQNWTMYNNGK